MKSNARALSTAGPAREICASSVVAREVGSGGCGPHLHDRRSVVGDGGDALVVVDELVEPAGTLRARSGWGGGGVVGRSAGNTKTAKKDGWRARRRSRASFGGEAHQGGADGVHDRHARVDVGDQLALALARVRALAQEHDLGLLLVGGGWEEEGERRRSTVILVGKGRDARWWVAAVARSGGFWANARRNSRSSARWASA